MTPYEIIKVNTYYKFGFEFIGINYEDMSSKSNFVAIHAKDSLENEKILIMRVNTAKFASFRGIIWLNKNEILKNILILPISEERELLVIYTNQKLKLFNLY